MRKNCLISEDEGNSRPLGRPKIGRFFCKLFYRSLCFLHERHLFGDEIEKKRLAERRKKARFWVRSVLLSLLKQQKSSRKAWLETVEKKDSSSSTQLVQPPLFRSVFAPKSKVPDFSPTKFLSYENGSTPPSFGLFGLFFLAFCPK